MRGTLTVWLLLAVLALPVMGEEAAAPVLKGEPFVYTEWESFTVESTKGGLPNDHIFALKADGDRLWVGTEGGLALYENGEWTHWTEEDGMPWKVVTAITVHPKTGDVWLGLFGGGVARFSGGRFDHYHQLNSGLANDVVYGITTEGDNIWIATTAGTNRFNTVTQQWDIFTEKNAPMHEIWCYNINSNDGKVYVAVWGGGVLEWDIKTEDWKEYTDPDGEMEIDLYRNDGLLHVISTAVSFVEKTLWVSSYFGMSRYDGRHWNTYQDHDSGLASSFMNHIVGRSAIESMASTDKGLSMIMDFDSDTWVTYHKPCEEDKTWTASVRVGQQEVKKVETNLCLPNHFMICADYQGDDVWIGTGKGLARGIGKGYYPGLKAE